MKSLLIRTLPIIIGLLLNQLQACKSSNPCGWYLNVKKSEYEVLKQKQECQAKELEQAQKLLEEREQNPTSVIEEEEKILEMMEDREIPEGSGNRYQYIPARENDCVAKTGQPKYLPVDTCETYGMNCEPEMKYVETRRQKKSISPQD